MIADHRCVTPGYFAAMDARLLEGRYFNSLAWRAAAANPSETIREE